MIKPYGSDELNALQVADPVACQALLEAAETLRSVTLSAPAAANVVMLGAGYFNPMTGFMDKADTMSVARTMHTTAGVFWPIPVLNLIHDAGNIQPGDRIALRDPGIDGEPVMAVMDVRTVERFSDAEKTEIAQHVFRAAHDQAHPGVDTFMAQGNVCLAGPIQVLNFSYFRNEFPDTFRTAVEIREDIARRGWHKVVAFQTRNPMHLAHEELCHMAMERLDCDGLIIHMLLGRLKQGDIPADVREAAIRKMVELYFPSDSVMVAGYGFDMLYAGPKEAVLHAVMRQNMGATHFIIGRDHAGVGDHYGAFDAQTIFDEEVPEGALAIEIFRADQTAWSKKLDKVVMMSEAPDHRSEDFVLLSGTRVREMLGKGISPPKEFSRPEVAKILIDYYRGIA